MYGYIYLTTNLVTGQKYIGMHKYSKEGIDPDYIGSGKHLWNSIKYHNYNIHNDFTVDIIDTADNYEELCSLEEYYIDLYNAIKDPMYYNLNKGGNGSFDYINKNHLAPSMTGNPEDHPMYGIRGEDNPRYGMHHSEETKELLSEIQKDRVHITNGTLIKSIKKYAPLPDGWWYGEPYNPNREWDEDRKKHHSELMTGHVVMNNGIETICVPEYEVPSKLKEGYTKGYRADQMIKTKPVNNDHIKGSKWITNGKINHRYKGEKLEKYLGTGEWWLGFTPNKNK